MNERIQELITDCTEYVSVTSLSGTESIETYFDKEKFAELLIRECYKKIEEVRQTRLGLEYESDDDVEKLRFAEGAYTCDIVTRVIREHFKVDE